MKIAIVGAGPRGLSAAERVIEWARKTEINVQLTLFDPYGPGGKIWRAEQPNYLLMNTVISQVTLFTDESLVAKDQLSRAPLSMNGPKQKLRSTFNSNNPIIILSC